MLQRRLSPIGLWLVLLASPAWSQLELPRGAKTKPKSKPSRPPARGRGQRPRPLPSAAGASARPPLPMSVAEVRERGWDEVDVVFVALHMARVFFTGAYKAPREFTWLSGAATSAGRSR